MNPIRDEYSKIEASTQSKDKILKNILYSNNRKKSETKFIANPFKIGSVILGMLIVFVLVTPLIKKQLNLNSLHQGQPLVSTIKEVQTELTQMNFNLAQVGFGLPAVRSYDIKEDFALYNSGENVTHLHVFKNPDYNPNFPAAPPKLSDKQQLIEDARVFIEMLKLDETKATFVDLKDTVELKFDDYDTTIRKGTNSNSINIQILQGQQFIDDYGLQKYPVEKVIRHQTKQEKIKQLEWGRNVLKLQGEYQDHIECELYSSIELMEWCTGYSYLSSNDDAQLIFNELSTKFWMDIINDEINGTLELNFGVSIPKEFESFGYYPIISPLEANEKLLRNEYTSSMTYQMKADTPFYNQGLVYFGTDINERIIPVYKYFVDVTDEFQMNYEEGKTYGYFYVSAIDGEYVKSTFNSYVSYPNLVTLKSENLYHVHDMDININSNSSENQKYIDFASNKEGIYLGTVDIVDNSIRKLSFYNIETKEIEDIKEFDNQMNLYTLIEHHNKLFAIILDQETNQLYMVFDWCGKYEKWVKLVSAYASENYQFIQLEHQLFLSDSTNLYKIVNEDLVVEQITSNHKQFKIMSNNLEKMLVSSGFEGNQSLLVIDSINKTEIELENELLDAVVFDDSRIIGLEKIENQIRIVQLSPQRKIFNVVINEEAYELEYLNFNTALITSSNNVKGLLSFKADGSPHYQEFDFNYEFLRILSDSRILVIDNTGNYRIIELNPNLY